MGALYDAVTARIEAVEERTDAFRDAVLDYHALADTDTGRDGQMHEEAEAVVDAWLAMERERKQLDAVVKDLGATFHVTVRDAEGREEATDIAPDTVSGLFQATYGSVQNVTDLDPHPRYTEEDAATLLAAIDDHYTDLAAADRAYVQALDTLAAYEPVIAAKRERARRETALDDPYQEIDRVLADRADA